MVLDPVSALGLASSVIQFVDFGTRLISKGKEYHDSVDGALVEHKELRLIASNIVKLTSGLDESLSKLDKGQAQTSADTALRDITIECRAKAEQFSTVVDKLIRSDTHKKWNSLRQAFKSIWKAEELEKMLTRLESLREQLMLNLLVVMNNRRADELKSLLSSQDRMEKSILSTVDKARNDIKEELVRLSNTLARANQSDRVTILNHWQTANRDEVVQMMSDVEELTEKENSRKRKNAFLASLYFSQVDDRYTRIPIAHERTFRWIYEHPPADAVDWSDFVGWLEDRSDNHDVFWISGKAGSGKSTLMRYLIDDGNTRHYLSTWHGNRLLLLATCFFWNSGSAIQKSLNGLLRSLLYQLLRQHPAVIPLVAPERWRSLTLGATKLEEWMDTELLSVLDKLMTRLRDDVYVCIFVDGLDEFDGDDQSRLQVISLFRNLARSSKAKICLSSRPWLIFQDEFAACPKLRLENLTQNDIHNYVEARLMTSSRFQLLQQVASFECEEMIKRITQKAAGVFLWVYLVTRSLLEGLRDGDSMNELSATLDSFPSDLETFFKHMMTTIESKYRPEAAKLFRLVLDYFDSEPEDEVSISLMTVSFIAEKDQAFALNLPVQTLTMPQLDEKLEAASRRLNSRCKGFLEVYAADMYCLDMDGSVAPKRIDFLHRTVRDFLLTKDMQEMLDEHCKGTYDQRSYLSSSFLAQMKMIKRRPVRGNDRLDVDDMMDLVQNFVRFTRGIEDFTERNFREVEEMVKLISIYRDFDQSSSAMDVQWWREWKNWDDPALYFAITEGLPQYVQARFTADPSCMRSPRERPLLDFALRRYLEETNWRTPPNPTIVSELLNHSASLEETYLGWPLWSHYHATLANVCAKLEINFYDKWAAGPFYQSWVESTRIVRQKAPAEEAKPPHDPFPKALCGLDPVQYKRKAWFSTDTDRRSSMEHQSSIGDPINFTSHFDAAPDKKPSETPESADDSSDWDKPCAANCPQAPPEEQGGMHAKTPLLQKWRLRLGRTPKQELPTSSAWRKSWSGRSKQSTGRSN